MYMGYTGADAPALCAAAQAALQRGSPSAPALIQRCADATALAMKDSAAAATAKAAVVKQVAQPAPASSGGIPTAVYVGGGLVLAVGIGALVYKFVL